MTTAYAIKTIEKATSLKVFTNNNHNYKVTNDTNKLTWIDQAGEVTCLHVMGVNEQSDPMTDYFPGSFYETVKSALRAFNRY